MLQSYFFIGRIGGSELQQHLHTSGSWSTDAACHNAQVDSLLAGMPLADDARAIRAAADASWEQLQAVLPEKAALAAFGGRRPSRADFQWAFSMLLSRLIRLRSLGDREALVPWADLLNHSPDSDAYLDWDAAQRAVVLRADAAAQPEQQLFASYGAKGSGALLLRCPVPCAIRHRALHEAQPHEHEAPDRLEVWV